jgi:heme A synthase
MLTLVILLVGFLVWAIGLGQGLEDYCFTNLGSSVEIGGRGGPQFGSPWTLRCDYDDGSSLRATDFVPLIWSLSGLVVTGALVLGVWRLLVLRAGRPGWGRADRLALLVAAQGLALLAVASLLLHVPALVSTALGGGAAACFLAASAVRR